MTDYAVVTTFDLTENYLHDIESDSALHHVVVPMVTALPGFVSGVWTRNLDASSIDVTVVFASIARARDLLDIMSSTDFTEDGLVLRHQHLAVVLASA